MYRGWKSPGCRGWPVPRRGYGYGSTITSAQVKRQSTDAENGIVNGIDNNNTDCKSEVMKSELKLSPSFGMGYCYAVTVDGIVIALCHRFSAAVLLVREYRGRFERPDIEIVEVEAEIGKVYKR